MFEAGILHECWYPFAQALCKTFPRDNRYVTELLPVVTGDLFDHILVCEFFGIADRVAEYDLVKFLPCGFAFKD